MGGDDGKVRIWSLKTKKMLPPAVAHDGPVTWICFLKDGQTLISAGKDKTVRICKIGGGQAKKLTAPDAVSCLALDTSETFLAAGCENGKIGVWNLNRLQPLPVEMQHADRITSVQFLLREHQLLTAGRDGMVCIWDLQSGQKMAPPVYHGGSVIWTELSPDGHQLVTAGVNSLVRTWQFTDPFKLEVRTTNITSVRLRSDQRQLVVTREAGSPQICELGGQRLVVSNLGVRPSGSHACFAPDSSIVAVANADGTTAIWDAQTHDHLFDLQSGPESDYRS